MFILAAQVFPLVNLACSSKIGIPEIRIKDYEVIDAEGMDGAIIISSGLINHCLNTPCAFIEKIWKSEKFFADLNYEIVAALMLAWVLAHEHTHNARGHNNVIKEHGNSTDVLHALERDADLCAIAAIYRITERTINNQFLKLRKLDLKKITLYLIFWPLRTLAFDENSYINYSSSHPSIILRMHHIITKLAILNDVFSNELPDINCTKPETTETAYELAKILCYCEAEFQLSNGKNIKESKFISEYLEEFEKGKYLEAVKAWDTIILNREDHFVFRDLISPKIPR